MVDYSFGVSRNLAVSTDLADTLRDVSYESYRDYIVSNRVWALFNDEAMTQPFPFVFSLNLNTNGYFRVPDLKAAVYRRGLRDSDFTISDLVCAFNNPIENNSTLTVVSDFCLRLCYVFGSADIQTIDVEVWTNIPNGTYVGSNSPSIMLSTDGETFSKFVRILGKKLYLRGALTQKDYGFNNMDVMLFVANCEVYRAIDK